MASNDIGTQTGTNGSSMALNTQKNLGGEKPSEKGNHNPGGTNPGCDGMGKKVSLSGK